MTGVQTCALPIFAAYGFTAAAAANIAIKGLRGEAHEWFNGGLKLVDKPGRDAALANVDAFWGLFKPVWFKVQSTKDISTNWATLARMEAESPSHFFMRTCNAVQQLEPLIDNAPVPAQLITDLHARSQACMDAFHAQGGVANHNDVVAAKAAYMQQLQLVIDACSNLEKHHVLSHIIMKVVAAGMRHPKMRELVRREEAAFVDLKAAYLMVKDAEKAFHPATWKHGSAQGPARAQSSLDHEPEECDDAEPPAEEVAKVASKKEKKKQAQAAKRRQHPQQQAPPPPVQQPQGAAPAGRQRQPRWDYSKPPPPEAGPCRACGKPGHWKWTCPARVANDAHQGGASSSQVPWFGSVASARQAPGNA